MAPELREDVLDAVEGGVPGGREADEKAELYAPAHTAMEVLSAQALLHLVLGVRDDVCAVAQAFKGSRGALCAAGLGGCSPGHYCVPPALLCSSAALTAFRMPALENVAPEMVSTLVPWASQMVCVRPSACAK